MTKSLLVSHNIAVPPLAYLACRPLSLSLPPSLSLPLSQTSLSNNYLSIFYFLHITFKQHQKIKIELLASLYPGKISLSIQTYLISKTRNMNLVLELYNLSKISHLSKSSRHVRTYYISFLKYIWGYSTIVRPLVWQFL